MTVLRRSLAALIAATVVLAVGAAAASARVLLVTQQRVSYPHYSTIQAAVGAARRGDWIVVAPGAYTGTVRIRTPDLHVRGMNRNTVILDGGHRVGNGIVITASGVWVENLTVRNFDRRTRDDSADGNEVWWEGAGPEGTRIGIHGWWGQYLTAYDTGLLGGYGLYAGHSVDGFFKHVYASGFNDSGVYVGGCRDCEALVQDALVERNALGWSSTNAGGHLVVEDSTFRDNSVGVAPDSEPESDLPPPQDGACNSASNSAELPTFTTTQIDRCTIFRDNPTFGVLVLERPDPFPPTSNTVYFQSSGNQVSENTVTGNAKLPGTTDLALEGGVFGTMNSVNNCFSGNTFGSSSPGNIDGTWGCQNATTPNGGDALFAEILKLIAESGARHQKPQPAPRPQPTMPRPCRGVPRNPLCG